MSNQRVTTLSDGGNPTKQAEYQKMVQQARAKSAAPAQPLSGVPRFDQLPKETPPPPGAEPARTLSPATRQGLEALARQQPVAPPQPTAQAESTPAPKQEDAAEETSSEATTDEEDEEAKLKKAIEARLRPIDIGKFILSNEAEQLVSIIPEQLEVVFRTVTDFEETFVDLQLSKEKDLTSGRQFLRRQSEWALALHIKSINGTDWPKPLSADGNVNAEAALDRLSRVRKLPGPVFTLLGQNLSWFLERVSKSLTLSALKNG